MSAPRLLASAALVTLLAACPPGGADTDAGVGGACHTAADCSGEGTTSCAPPQRATFPRPACGACLTAEDECSTDTDCGSGFACRPEGPCGCGQVTLICVVGCSEDADCLAGQTCDDDAHCVDTPCSTAAECDVHFTCTGGRCARATCDNGVCDDGECVVGLCYGSPGTCVEAFAVP